MNRKQRRAAGKTDIQSLEQIERLNAQGIAFGRAGIHAQAMTAFQSSLHKDKSQPRTWYNLGKSLAAQNLTRDAKDAFASAITLKPDYAEAHNGLGWCWLGMGEFHKAAESFRRSIEANPLYAEVHANLGNALKQVGCLDDSVAACREAIRLNPNFSDAYNSLGGALEYSGKLDLAVEAYRQAIRLTPNHASAHANLGLALLKSGQFQEGWNEYEWRWQANSLPFPRFPQPVWNGEDLNGKTLLLWAEQGFGDTVHFIRYAPVIANRGAQVVVMAQPTLVRLLNSVPGISRIIPDGDPAPDCDFHLPMLSAPRVLGLPLPEQAPTHPYITAPSETAFLWKQLLAEFNGQKVGLVWAGSSNLGLAQNNAMDRRRSIPLTQLLPLLKSPGYSFISLQTGEAASQVQEIDERYRPQQIMDGIKDFADTAAIVANLDLIITVDTAVAHLAAALGKPVWVLSRFDGCWRWQTGRDDSPWYPSLTLFRQTHWGNWEGVIERVRERL